MLLKRKNILQKHTFDIKTDKKYLKYGFKAKKVSRMADNFFILSWFGFTVKSKS